jgi:acyl-CoA reductase-like NAD-dependent aldehyde dehydrogenase
MTCEHLFPTRNEIPAEHRLEPHAADAYLVDDALGKGAQVVNRGGGESCQTLLLAAVLHPVVPGMRLWDEEQWGPVVPGVAFDDLETPGSCVLASKYGQHVSASPASSSARIRHQRPPTAPAR